MRGIIFFIIVIAILFGIVYWIYKTIKAFLQKRYRNGIINLSIILVLGLIISWELGILPLAADNYFKNKTEDLTGKKFWSWNEFRVDDISVRGEGFTFEIYRLNPEMVKYFQNPDSTFFKEYPNNNFKATKWRRTPIIEKDKEAFEFVMGMYANWDEKKKNKVKQEQDFVRKIMTIPGAYYSRESVADETFYIISPKEKVIIWINNNM
jgi:hypothetical protein